MNWSEPILIQDKWYMELSRFDEQARSFKVGRVTWSAIEDTDDEPNLYTVSVSYLTEDGIAPPFPSVYELSRAQDIVEELMNMTKEDAVKKYGARKLKFHRVKGMKEFESY